MDGEFEQDRPGKVFVAGLAIDVDEKILESCFSKFGRTTEGGCLQSYFPFCTCCLWTLRTICDCVTFVLMSMSHLYLIDMAPSCTLADFVCVPLREARNLVVPLLEINISIGEQM